MDEARHADVELWLRKASDDAAVARLVLEQHGPAAVGCFLCQQAAEKFLKACMVAAGMDPPRTHDLERIAQLLETAGQPVEIDPDLLASLTQYAIAPRYPGFPDDQADRDLSVLVAFVDEIAAAVKKRIDRLGAKEDDLPSGPR